MNVYEYYQANAQQFVANTLNLDLKAAYREFLNYMPEKGRILDAGCGSGRDSRYFLEKGYEIVAFDFSEEMVKLASKYINRPVLHLSFEEISFHEEFDGVWASASLLHMPKNSIHIAMNHLAASLRRNGIFYCSFKYGDKEETRTGRFFNNYTEDTIATLVNNVPCLQIEKFWRIEDNRAERTGEFWFNVLLKKAAVQEKTDDKGKCSGIMA